MASDSEGGVVSHLPVEQMHERRAGLAPEPAAFQAIVGHAQITSTECVYAPERGGPEKEAVRRSHPHGRRK